MKLDNIGNARELSIHILLDVLEKDAFANLTIDTYLNSTKLSKLDRAFTTQLVYGVIRHKYTLDWVLAQLVGQKFSKVKPIIKTILLVGLYQIMYLDKVPPSAACNEAAKLARKYGHAGVVGFVNGVLRNSIRKKDDFPFPDPQKEPVQHLAIKHSHPQWLVERWLKRYGFANTESLCQYNNQPSPIWLRCNTLKTNVEQLADLLRAGEIDVTKSEYAPDGLKVADLDRVADLPGYTKGEFIVQDESSMVVGYVVSPRPGDKVIDACSAPGGKTTHLAQLMNNKGEIRAFDVHQHKLKLITDNCARLGVEIVSAKLQDATELSEDLFDWADCVLTDVPCSGTGVLGRRADARWRKTPEQLSQLPHLQLAILTRASKCVKVNGTLVYSTCSIEPEENTQVVDKFLKENPNFVRVNLDSTLPFIASETDQEQVTKGMFQFLPHIHGTDGFFVARMVRIK